MTYITNEQLNELIEKYGFFSVTRRKNITPSLVLKALLELKQMRAQEKAKVTKLQKNNKTLTHLPSFLNEICGKCGKRFGSHHGGTSPWPRNYCPDSDCRMDWENGPGTVFEPTGNYEEQKVD